MHDGLTQEHKQSDALLAASPVDTRSRRAQSGGDAVTRPPDYPHTIVAQVWRYRGRRYLTKRAAFMAAARDVMRAEHEHIASDDRDIGAYCRCRHCEDAGEVATRQMASAMARGDA